MHRTLVALRMLSSINLGKSVPWGWYWSIWASIPRLRKSLAKVWIQFIKTLSSTSHAYEINTNGLFLFTIGSSATLLRISGRGVLSIVGMSTSAQGFKASCIASFGVFISSSLFILIDKSLRNFCTSFSSRAKNKVLYHLILDVNSSFSRNSAIYSPYVWGNDNVVKYGLIVL